jgi:nucleoside-diphosphate-sugar epimerase
MNVLVLGASGATGRLVVMQLNRKKIHARIVVRERAILPDGFSGNELVEIVKGNISDFDGPQFQKLMDGCDAVVCCLGHNLTFKGLYGKPRKLVYGVIRRLADAITAGSRQKVRLILMSTTAYTNKAVHEKNTPAERIAFFLIKALLPPHADNVDAADCLIHEIGKENAKIEWIAVRPDTLINDDQESGYDVLESPIRSPVFNAGKTSRINVGHFMAELLTDEKLWQRWKFKTPVLYNKTAGKNADA